MRPDPSELIYHSYADAAAACQSGGYQYEKIVEVVVEKNALFRVDTWDNRRYDLSTLRTLIGVGLACDNRKIRVMDFGGAGGYHYTIARLALGQRMDIRWNVVETPAMSSGSKRLSDQSLNFFDNIADAKKDLEDVDLVFTSGALQCTPDPMRYLQELVDVEAKHLFITRTALNIGSQSIVTVQKTRISSNGPGPLPPQFSDETVYYPVTFVPKHYVEAVIGMNYDIRFMTEEDRGTLVADGQVINNMYGYFCDLRTAR